MTACWRFGTRDHTTEDTVENVAESRNLVSDPTLQKVVANLSAQLHSGWRRPALF